MSKRPRDETDDSSEPSSTRSTPAPDSRRRRKDSVQAYSKIPKNDVRRSYPLIFKDAFNACDGDIFEALLTKHCTENCGAFYRYVGTNNPYGDFDHMEAVGIPAIAAYWGAIFSAVPDSLFDIVETKFRLLPNRQTSIVCKFLYSGTKVYKLATDDTKSSVIYVQKSGSNAGSVDRGDMSVDGVSVDGSDDMNSVAAPTIRTLPGRGEPAKVVFSTDDKQDERPFHEGAYMAEPQRVAIIGTFTLYTNNEQKIFRFEFIFSVRQ
ncbi:hypothetical protein EON64_04285 [archaeon]|nr:MAG: hypothetical protein EON64_04285 [archaeon]